MGAVQPQRLLLTKKTALTRQTVRLLRVCVQMRENMHNLSFLNTAAAEKTLLYLELQYFKRDVSNWTGNSCGSFHPTAARRFTHDNRAVICQHSTSIAISATLRPPPHPPIWCVLLFKSLCDREEGQRGAGDILWCNLLSITLSVCIHSINREVRLRISATPDQLDSHLLLRLRRFDLRTRFNFWSIF